MRVNLQTWHWSTFEIGNFNEQVRSSALAQTNRISDLCKSVHHLDRDFLTLEPMFSQPVPLAG